MPSLKLQISAPVTGRLPVLDELKGVAILLVVLYHAGGVLVWQNLLHGDVGVDIFVVLSGVGLSLGSGYSGARQFLLKRFIRIFPAYWLVLTAYLLLNTHFLQKQYTTTNIVLHYLGIHGWFGDIYAMSINDSLWFVTLIVSLYLLYALLYRIIHRPDWLLFAGSVLSVTAALAFFFTGQAGCFSHIALRIPGFFIGLLLGQLLRSARVELPASPVMAAAIFLITYLPYTQGIVFYSAVVGLGLMIVYTFGWKRWAPRTAEQSTARVLKFLGDHSLEIFLIHQPLIREYNSYLHGRWLNEPSPTPTSMIIGMAIGFAVTLFLAVELHRLQGRVRFPAKASSSS